ncbi:MAG TPA: hypothetical protein VG796_15520 [Verrucomicrobiales bacterium]|nr:hypothetical protein [Verrucomicrobiales bacterium]
MKVYIGGGPIDLIENATPYDEPFEWRESEKELLTSRSLAGKVVGEIGANRISKGSGGDDAVSEVVKGLSVRTEKGNSVIVIAFRHADPETAQAGLRALYENYFIELGRRLELEREREKKEDEAAIGSEARAEVDQPQRARRSPSIAVVQAAMPGRQDKARNLLIIGMMTGGPLLGALVMLVFGKRAKRADQQCEPSVWKIAD